MRPLISILIVLSLGFSSLDAQESEKYGSSKDLCLRNYSLYKGYFKNKDYEDAKMFWNRMVEICPEYSKGLWSDGEKIFKALIDLSNDPIKKVELIDSLMWTYDQRIKYFGNDLRYPKGYILGKKGLAQVNYGVQPISDAYNNLKESIETQDLNSYPAVLLTFMKVAKSMFGSGQIEAEEMINNYSMCMKIAEMNLRKAPNDEDFIAARDGIEQYLISCNAADCSTLVNIFSAQFHDNKDDSAWLTKISDLLKSTGCKDTELYKMSAEALFTLEPSSESAHMIANMYFTMGNYEKAADYLLKGVELGDNLEESASMYYELAYINYTQFKDFQKAREYAREALELRPNWGDPYILIGRMYIDGRQSVSSKTFEQEAVFWAAVDKFIEAKKVDPEQSQKANELINQYSQYFPINEDVFMWTLEDGKVYRVGGWINEQTTVRSRKN